MLVQFGNNWIQKIPLTAKLDSAYGLVQSWRSFWRVICHWRHIDTYIVLSQRKKT